MGGIFSQGSRFQFLGNLLNGVRRPAALSLSLTTGRKEDCSYRPEERGSFDFRVVWE